MIKTYSGHIWHIQSDLVTTRNVCLSDLLKHLCLDGLMLYALEDEDLDGLLVNISSLQRRAFWIALSELRAAGVKLPKDFWEYKVMLFYWCAITLKWIILFLQNKPVIILKHQQVI